MMESVDTQTRVLALYVDVTRDYACAKALEIAALAHRAGFSVVVDPAQAEALDFSGDGARFEDASLLVTVGGDGTLLRAARLAAPHGIPLFGINAGRLGFLTEVDVATDLSELITMLNEGFYNECRLALEARIDGRRLIAVNDVVVRKQGASRVVPFSLEIDQEDAAHIPCTV